MLPTSPSFRFEDPVGYAGCAFCTMGLEFMIRHERLLIDSTKTLVLYDIDADIKTVYHMINDPAINYTEGDPIKTEVCKDRN